MTTHWQHFSLTQDANGIVWLRLLDADNPVNRLHGGLLSEFHAVLDHLETSTCNGIVLFSGRQPHFIAGADVSSFTTLAEPRAIESLIDTGWRLAERIESLQTPTLALVQGQCLGGGLELALAFQWLVAVDHPDTRFALPEVRLGIFPAWGGIKRLPRAVGPATALSLMLNGRSLGAHQAKRLGLCHALVPERLAHHAASEILLGRSSPHKRPSARQSLASLRPLRPLVALPVRRRLAQLDPFGHYPAAPHILRLWQERDGDPRGDPASLALLLHAPATRALLRVFALQERLKAIGRQGITPRPIRHVHVVGAGLMGGDIAAWCALKGLTVSLQDTNTKQIGLSIARARTLFFTQLEPLRAQQCWDGLIPDPEGHGLRRADVVIEAIAENQLAKQQVYQHIEPLMARDALLATNTSSFTLDQLASVLHHPERFVGLHFFNPVARMPLVEVVSDASTQPEAISRALQLVHQLGKLPLPVRSAPGFLVNAALAPYLHEAMRCLGDGVSRDLIDHSLRAFGMPMGPLELIDTIGLDIVRDAGVVLGGIATPPCLSVAIADGRLGRKSGQGFYRWQHGKPVGERRQPPPDPALAQCVLEPLFQRVANLADTVVDDHDLADAGLVFGAGFPPFLGGPLYYRKSGV